MAPSFDNLREDDDGYDSADDLDFSGNLVNLLTILHKLTNVTDRFTRAV